jgi:starvation-inducible DNA-binding protein
MLVSSSNSAREPSATEPLTTADMESCKTVAVLEELLAQSIHLRDLYKNARWQTPDVQNLRLHQLFDAHYREQLHLVDVLIDRMRTLGGTDGVFAGNFLNSRLPHSLRGRASLVRLLRELLEAHELALGTAQPAGTNDAGSDRSWTRDFAVGQVVLTNDLQRSAVSERLMGRDLDQRLLKAHASFVRAPGS